MIKLVAKAWNLDAEKVLEKKLRKQSNDMFVTLEWKYIMKNEKMKMKCYTQMRKTFFNKNFILFFAISERRDIYTDTEIINIWKLRQQ